MSVEFFDHGDQDVDAQWRRLFGRQDELLGRGTPDSLRACYESVPHSIAQGIEQAASKPLFSDAAERRRARVGYGGMSNERLAW